MQYLYPLNAIHKDGRVVLLYTIEEARAFIGKYGRWYDRHVESYWGINQYGLYRETKTNGWIVRDDRGRTVPVKDIEYQYPAYWWYNQRIAEARRAAEKGLPIPGTGGSKKCWKMNHTAKKNSGAGHRNRNRSLAAYEEKEYGIKNTLGRVIPWEHY